MKRHEKADLIGDILDDLYPNPPIPLDRARLARCPSVDDIQLLVRRADDLERCLTDRPNGNAHC